LIQFAGVAGVGSILGGYLQSWVKNFD
jgi:hypothetical protein